MFNEPHSTKQIEDAVGWALETDAEVLTDSYTANRSQRQAEFRALCGRVRVPTLVLHGEEDQIRPHGNGREPAEVTGGPFVLFEGSGHDLQGRDPVKVNLLLRDVLAPRRPAGRRRRGRARGRRALYVSSP